MNSSNSFNICPRCGNSNALSARYCSRCGGPLKVPEEPVICHKCHTHNSPVANFCRNCGTLLKKDAETRTCPKCGKEVSKDRLTCSCGYSFDVKQQPQSNDKVDRKEKKAVKATKEPKQPKVKGDKVYGTKGGRGWAIAGIIFVLLFAYLIVAPYQARPTFLTNFDKGLFNSDELTAYGYNCVANIISIVKDVVGGANFVDVIGSFSIAEVMILVLAVIFIVTALVHLVVCIIRSVTTKRSKKMNLYFLIVAIVTTLVVGLMTLFTFVDMPKGFLQTVASWFVLPSGLSLGWAIWAIPLYFWFFFLYSLFAKAKKLKEQA